MAEISTIARPYAEAVFEFADRGGQLEQWSAMLDTLINVADHVEVRALLGNPNVSRGQLAELVLSLCGDALTPEARNLVHTLVDNARLPAAAQVKQQFEQLKHEREGMIEAEIGTAYALDDAQLASLVAGLEARFKRKIRPRVTVERELIGGVRVVVGDEVIDGSVRGRLAAMAAALKQ